MVGYWFRLVQLYHILRQYFGFRPDPNVVATLIPKTKEGQRRLWNFAISTTLSSYYKALCLPEEALLKYASDRHFQLENTERSRQISEIRLLIALIHRRRIYSLRELHFGTSPAGISLLNETLEEHFSWIFENATTKNNLREGTLPEFPLARSRL